MTVSIDVSAEETLQIMEDLKNEELYSAAFQKKLLSGVESKIETVQQETSMLKQIFADYHNPFLFDGSEDDISNELFGNGSS